mmetsp:Transcript_20226/g.36682  ORF Transcript_20226/g.36682 Transcript_20226/m.36682 type:complete len:302 (+) Transcript_20226:153-1058(+)
MLDVVELSKLLNVGICPTDASAIQARSFLQLVLSNGQEVDHVGTICQPQSPSVRVQLWQPGVLRHSMTTVDLDCLVYDLQTRPWGCHLYHGDVGLRSLESVLVCHTRGQVTQLLALCDLDPGFCNALTHSILLSQNPSKGLPAMDPVDYGRQGLLCDTQSSHAMVYASRTKPSLSNLKATSFSQQDVRLWYPNIFKQNFSMIFSVPKDFQGTHNRYALGVLRHQNHGLLLVSGPSETSLPQENKHLALGAQCAGDPPLVTVDDVVITRCLNARGYVGCIAGSNSWLRHSIGRANLTSKKRL